MVIYEGTHSLVGRLDNSTTVPHYTFSQPQSWHFYENLLLGVFIASCSACISSSVLRHQTVCIYVLYR